MKESNKLRIGLAQISPVWLNKQETTNKIEKYIGNASKEGCDLVVFGEALLPGYPFWLSFTNGSQFESKMQKEIHAHYIRNAVNIDEGDLDSICKCAAKNKIAVYLGTIERAQNRGGHSLYCTLVYINKLGQIQSAHRKLQPTYEERLTWSPGDGNGLRVHKLNDFTVGGLNCWENWMPLPRTALYGLGEDLHIAVWPGSKSNTVDISRFIAKEARSFVVSVSGLLTKDDFPPETPHFDIIREAAPNVMANGGSCIVGPDGEWVLEPIENKEGIFTAELDFNRVLEERQNFDPSGHYSRPDVTKLVLSRERQSTLQIEDEGFRSKE